MADKKTIKDPKLAAVVLGPRVTEKAAILAGEGAYTFNVARTATKIQIKEAIKQIYNISPVRVTVATIPYKKVVRRGSVGKKGGGKKAVVFLKKGDTIDLF